MKQKIEDLKQAFQLEIEKVQQTKELEMLRIKYLGKKSPIQALMHDLRTCSPEERPEMGKLINTLKQDVSAQIDSHFKALEAQELLSRLSEEKVDVTLPGRRKILGKKHPLSQMLDEVIEILVGMGFSVQESPEIETEYYNYFK